MSSGIVTGEGPVGPGENIGHIYESAAEVKDEDPGV